MAATRITVLNNASLRIEGDFEIVDAEGRPFGLAGRTKVSLCRCGQSSNKPFCDAAHKQCQFQSVVAAFDLPEPKPPATAPATGPAPPASKPAAAPDATGTPNPPEPGPKP